MLYDDVWLQRHYLWIIIGCNDIRYNMRNTGIEQFKLYCSLQEFGHLQQNIKKYNPASISQAKSLSLHSFSKLAINYPFTDPSLHKCWLGPQEHMGACQTTSLHCKNKKELDGTTFLDRQLTNNQLQLRTDSIRFPL